MLSRAEAARVLQASDPVPYVLNFSVLVARRLFDLFVRVTSVLSLFAPFFFTNSCVEWRQ